MKNQPAGGHVPQQFDQIKRLHKRCLGVFISLGNGPLRQRHQHPGGNQHQPHGGGGGFEIGQGQKEVEWRNQQQQIQHNGSGTFGVGHVFDQHRIPRPEESRRQRQQTGELKVVRPRLQNNHCAGKAHQGGQPATWAHFFLQEQRRTGGGHQGRGHQQGNGLPDRHGHGHGPEPELNANDRKRHAHHMQPQPVGAESRGQTRADDPRQHDNKGNKIFPEGHHGAVQAQIGTDVLGQAIDNREGHTGQQHPGCAGQIMMAFFRHGRHFTPSSSPGQDLIGV